MLWMRRAKESSRWSMLCIEQYRKTCRRKWCLQERGNGSPQHEQDARTPFRPCNTSTCIVVLRPGAHGASYLVRMRWLVLVPPELCALVLRPNEQQVALSTGGDTFYIWNILAGSRGKRPETERTRPAGSGRADERGQDVRPQPCTTACVLELRLGYFKQPCS